MNSPKVKMRQLVDWRAALWAGIISGIVFLVINMLLMKIFVGSPWITVRLVASIMLGAGVLPPPASFDPTIFAVALLVHFPLSIAFACLIAVILHRWGMLVGIIGGAFFGLALYAINFYTFTFFFPTFFPMHSWIMAVSHLLFGATAGGVYEGLEIEKFVPAASASGA
ncbi:MAG: hypothetical protein ALAOOOJD_01796 [bacterium]|nr:hypothetical protein [bacterium]